ncbi:MAG: molybdate transport system substrate-binding protein [Thermoleophilaceae bacterium]|nr:molybdate transport system substrate-binding protein [Thermoleophilaceae bacterium]
MRRVALLLAVAVAVVGCGADNRGDQPRVVVSAAASMTGALNGCAPLFGNVRLSFAGSDELAAQIRQGVTPDVYAAANTKLPDALHDEGLLSAPVKFATNELVLAVPKDSQIASVGDLGRKGLKLAIGSESVPIGSYTRETLAKLPAAEAKAILGNVRSNEPDVKGIVGKLTQGAVDAGFVYVTDVKAAHRELRAIHLPPEVEPQVTYAAGVVDGAKQPARARAYLRDLLHGTCAAALRAAGFGPAP